MLCVLCPSWRQFGVVRFRVRDIPGRLSAPGPGGKEYSWRLKHKPDGVNFSHCEIQTFKDGKPVEQNSDISPTVKEEFRGLLALRMIVVKESEVSAVPKPTSDGHSTKEK